MKVVALNGGPRKNWNTATLLNHALEGAASQGAETEMVHLYDLNYKGCISCFACKLKNGPSYGRCAMIDDLTPSLQKVEDADAIIIGSPIYFGGVTGMLRSFLERLMFQYLVYDENYSSLFKKKMPTGFIYTMNVTWQQATEFGYEQNLSAVTRAMTRTFGTSESLFVTDTCQFDDYSKYVAPKFNAAEKAKRHQEVFPEDCRNAFEMGKRFSLQIKDLQK